MKHLLVGLIGGAGLSALSLVDTDKQINCGELVDCSKLDTSGFPFSFIKDKQPEIQDGTEFLANQFDFGPALANFVFWAVVAVALFTVLSWALEKLSFLSFLGVVGVIAASYFGLVQVF